MRYCEDPLYPNPADLFINKSKAIDHQIGGDHYKEMSIQPIEYIVKNIY